MISNQNFSSKNSSIIVNHQNYFYTIFLEDLGKLFFNLIDLKKFGLLFKSFKLVRTLSNSYNDMEDLVRFRLEESFGELFIDDLDGTNDTPENLDAGVKLNYTEIDYFQKNIKFESTKTFIPFKLSNFFGLQKKNKSNCEIKKNGKIKFINKVSEVNKNNLHFFRYSFFSVFEIESVFNKTTIRIKLNHLHLKVMRLVQKAQKEKRKVKLESLYSAFYTQATNLLEISSYCPFLKFLFNQIISDEKSLKSLYYISKNKKICFVMDHVKGKEKHLDLSREFIEFHILSQSTIFKKPKNANLLVSKTSIKSKIMYLLKKNKTITFQSLSEQTKLNSETSLQKLKECLQELERQSFIKIERNEEMLIHYI